MRAESCELTRDKKTKRRTHNLTYVVPKMVLTMGYTSYLMVELERKGYKST
jgi:hypothetical protein